MQLARRHPILCLVVLGRGSGELGVIGSCLDAAPNVIFEISALSDPGWPGRTVADVGAHRFVFGSGGNLPGAVELLEAAKLAPMEMRMVASGVAEFLDLSSWAEAWL